MKFKFILFIYLFFFFIIPTNALSNYDTRFDIDYSSISNSYSDVLLDSNNTKLSDFVDSLKNNTNLSRNYLIMPYFNNSGNLSRLYIFVFDDNSNYTFNFYGNNDSYFNFHMTSSDSKWGYNIRFDSLPSDIYSTPFYTSFITCASGGSCLSSTTFDYTFRTFISSSSISNSSNNLLSFSNTDYLYILYYSSMPLHISNTFDIDNSNIFYKSIYIDNVSIDVSSNFPTYYDYIYNFEPEPEPEPDLSNSLFNYVFWFTDNTTEYGILSNMYILLFLYCIGNMFIKFITIIYHTKNLNNRR